MYICVSWHSAMYIFFYNTLGEFLPLLYLCPFFINAWLKNLKDPCILSLILLKWKNVSCVNANALE